MGVTANSQRISNGGRDLAGRQLGWLYHLRAARTFFARDLRLWTYFRFNFLIDLSGVFSNLIIYGIMASLAGAQAPGGVDYVAFVAAGLAANALFNAALSAPHSGFMQAFWSNRTELILMSPVSLTVFIVGTSMQGYVRALFEVVIYLGGTWALFHPNWGLAGGWLPAIGLFLVALLALTGLGLIAASMIYYVDARNGQDPVRMVVGILAGLASGVYFPLHALSGWAQWVAQAIPQTWALDGLRRLLLGADLPLLPLQARTLGLPVFGGLGPVGVSFLVLLVYAGLALWVGSHMFRRGLAIAKKDGRLSRWV